VEGGNYKWLTYKEAAEQVDAIGSAMAAVGVAPHGRCGVYGANSPQWMITMQVGVRRLGLHTAALRACACAGSPALQPDST
jgi:long-subunit acyl-CoA synthetase (AMP-forming)